MMKTLGFDEIEEINKDFWPDKDVYKNLKKEILNNIVNWLFFHIFLNHENIWINENQRIKQRKLFRLLIELSKQQRQMIIEMYAIVKLNYDKWLAINLHRFSFMQNMKIPWTKKNKGLENWLDHYIK